MKQLAVTDEKIFHVYEVFDHKNNSHGDMRTSPHTAFGKRLSA